MVQYSQYTPSLKYNVISSGGRRRGIFSQHQNIWINTSQQQAKPTQTDNSTANGIVNDTINKKKPNPWLCSSINPSGTGPKPLAICWCCTHQMGAKCVRVTVCLCMEDNRSCKSGALSENFCNKVPTLYTQPGERQWYPTAPRLTTNVIRNI